MWGRSWLLNQLLPEVRVVVSGEIQSRYGIQLAAKSIEVVEDGGGDEGPHAGRFVPIYPVNKNIQARRMRTLIHRALDAAGRILDPLPAELLVRHHLPDLHDAIHEVHFPTERARLGAAMRRLIFHELFLIQAGLAARKARMERTEVGGRHRGDGSLLNPFLKGLAFGLTGAQERVVGEVLDDMRKEKPMRRLLQGDVGSGKTVVAVAALLTAVEAGGQGAIMAPTEVLAEQHYLSISAVLADLPVNVVLLTGSQGVPQRREAALDRISAGEAPRGRRNACPHTEGRGLQVPLLVVVDEQHRFGVGQRTVFREKGTTPDTLVMTATPIPRTLSLTLYGDLEVSLIDELPPGRKPVETTIVDPAERLGAYEEVRRELEDGRQAYVICPLVEESEALEDVRAAEELKEELAEEIFPERRVGLLHGRMKAQDKREVMALFRAGEIEVLVATVVVEVGVDVPNANAIVIEGSERFGLSQLHQLRGRVCRGLHSPKCFLVGAPKTDDSGGASKPSPSTRRVKLSEVGPGDQGAKNPLREPPERDADLKVAKILRDVDLQSGQARGLRARGRGSHPQAPRPQALRREIRELLGADVEGSSGSEAT